MPYVSLPELEGCIITWDFMEALHSRAYSHIMKNVYPNPTYNKFIVELKDNSKVKKVEFIDFNGKLTVYPNPSKDIFNVSFVSEDIQNLEVRVLNMVGEVIYTEGLEQFVGEYTKSINMSKYTKGVYFLEITTNNGVVNKKIVLQ